MEEVRPDGPTRGIPLGSPLAARPVEADRPDPVAVAEIFTALLTGRRLPQSGRSLAAPAHKQPAHRHRTRPPTPSPAGTSPTSWPPTAPSPYSPPKAPRSRARRHLMTGSPSGSCRGLGWSRCWRPRSGSWAVAPAETLDAESGFARCPWSVAPDTGPAAASASVSAPAAARCRARTSSATIWRCSS